MKFRTEVNVAPLQHPINYRSAITMMGSCFTGLIGNKLKERLFDVTVNPFGVIYNPVNLKHSLQALLDREEYFAEDLSFHDGLWFSFDHYTKYSDPDRTAALKKINDDFKPAREKLASCDFLILTLGSAYVYEYRETGRIVSNCHKIPAKEFKRYMLKVDRVVEEWTNLLEKLFTKRAGMQVIFTISPVRHLKDGFTENQRSKSVLHLSVAELTTRFPKSCNYFPAYEILMDELRDYRYYADDLVHPGNQATSFIWEKFTDYALDDESRMISGEVESLLKAVAHRPIHAGTPADEKFRKSTLKKIGKLQETFSFLQWHNFPLNTYL